MTRKQLINHSNKDVRFLANVIMTHHANPSCKLRGLAKLVSAGSVVRTGHFDLDVLIVDGCPMEWASLEEM